MKGKEKRVCAAWAVFLAVALALLLVAGALLPHHHCAGEECPLCAMTAGRTLFAILFAAFVSFTGATLRSLSRKSEHVDTGFSPRHQKVKLLN